MSHFHKKDIIFAYRCDDGMMASIATRGCCLNGNRIKIGKKVWLSTTSIGIITKKKQLIAL